MGAFLRYKCFVLLSILLVCRWTDGDNIVLPDQQQSNQQNDGQHIVGRQSSGLENNGNNGVNGHRQGKGLLDFVGLGTGPNVDPYIARTNANCLNGELAECFKSQAINTFTDFFNKDLYQMTENARIIRLPEYQLRSLEHEPFEYSSESRATDSEWDQLVKFAMRKVERFMKSTAFEIAIPDEVAAEGRYSPRFVDEIADEIDVIEDKKAPIFSRNKLKKLFIPLLLILKIFKLKLLLFLPLILGLASFKKLLGFLAIIIPGVIGYFKLCRPQQSYGPSYYSNGNHPLYTEQGLGPATYHHDHTHYEQQNYRPEPSFSKPYGDYYFKNAQNEGPTNSVRFGGNDLAYQGYSEYRNKQSQ